MKFQVEKIGRYWRWILIARNGTPVGRSWRDNFLSRKAAIDSIKRIGEDLGIEKYRIYDATRGFGICMSVGEW